MGYLKDQLIEGERVIFSTRPHQIALVKPALWAGGAIALLLVAALDRSLWFLFPAAAALALVAMPGWLKWRATQYIVTNRRLCVRTGILKVETFETVLSKVGTIGVEQDLAGRALGYGTVIVKGIGGGVESLPLIAEPLRLRRMVHEALAAG